MRALFVRSRSLHLILMAVVVLCCSPAKGQNTQTQDELKKTEAFLAAQRVESPLQHCSISSGNPYNQTVACQVWDGDEQRLQKPLRIELSTPGAPIRTIEPGAIIDEWHFWNDAKQIAIHSGSPGGPENYQLYDVATERLVESLPPPANLAQLPQWARNRSQLEDESVPVGPFFDQQQTAWIAKILRQIQTIQPGMTRKELTTIVTTEGGLFTRLRQRYVSRSCPYIKVDITFKAANGDNDPRQDENPEDKVETVSRPYLDWSIAD
jgi:hypothetical protein